MIPAHLRSNWSYGFKTNTYDKDAMFEALKKDAEAKRISETLKGTSFYNNSGKK